MADGISLKFYTVCFCCDRQAREISKYIKTKLHITYFYKAVLKHKKRPGISHFLHDF